MDQPNQMQSSSIAKEQTYPDDSGIKHDEKTKSLIDFLNKVVNEPVESLIIVDMIQRLGVESLFREQIKAILTWQYTHFSSLNHGKDDVYEIALRFRLLRQEGYRLPAGLWWKELGLGEKMKFARDQPLKWYMWSMAILTDPSLSELRVELIKPISLVYIIDDIFDVHGTVDELILFTKVIKIWDNACAEQLPEYMKKCFKVLNDIANDFGKIIFEKHGWNPTRFLKQMWANLCNAFLVEFQWNASGKLPKADDYLKNGIITSGVPLVLTHLFFLMGQNIANQSMDSKKEEVQLPNIIFLIAEILRLWDDLGCAQVN
ncbi:hypothetical protein EUGRSUZ_E03572 [Eucalyptus grandis]|uniref:Terpene synthase metal-binding domain-containing protein n=2 Tax=Eucalyptus grandis TaxID=71139 RepID=A0A059C902_EUCGR|nr:hypothetical protein EUGRSUZ_E03572 [Eucalyptus grandis]